MVADRLEVEREMARPLPSADFDYAGRRSSRVPLGGYLKHKASFYRAPRPWFTGRSSSALTATQSGSPTRERRLPDTSEAYTPGTWQPAPKMRPEPPPPPARS